MNDTDSALLSAAQTDSPPADFSERQEAAFQRLLSQYTCNMHLMAEHFPDVLEKLCQLELPCPLMVDESGEICISSPVFQGGLKEYRGQSRMFYEHFLNDKTAAYFDLSHYDPKSYETRKKEGNEHYFYKPFEAKYIDNLIEDQQKLVEQPRKNPPIRRILPVAMSLGTGFSFHLNWMVNDFDISHLIIIEPDLERLHLALFFVDLQAVMHSMSQPGKSVLLITASEKKYLSSSVMNKMRQYAPSYMMQYLRIYHDGHDKTFLKDFVQDLSDQMWSFFMGWGFIDDEVLSVYYTAVNHLNNLPLLLRPTIHGDDTPVFIVGSGPSLDGLVPLLKKNRERILLVSCGTSLSALKKNDIKPDLHIEIERTDYTAEVLKSSVGEEWLKDIPFVGTQLMSPNVYRMFKRKAGVLKESDTAARMMDPDRRYSHILTNPTCTNGGLHLLLELGFKNIYLAGIDVGFARADQHHAKSSLYYNNDGDKKTIAHVRKLTNSSMKSHLKVPGNFRKQVYTVRQFIFTRNVLSHTIFRYHDARVTNLNDGALINGAIPQRPSRFRATRKKADRKHLVDNIFANFSSQKHLNLKQRHGELVEQLDLLADDMDRLLTAASPCTVSESVNALSLLASYMNNPGVRNLPCINMVSGGIYIQSNICYRGLMLLNDDVLAAKCFRRFHVNLIQLLRRTRKTIAGIPVSQKTNKPNTATQELEHV